MSAVPVGIVGVSGYTGGEALRLLLGHPVFEVSALFGSSERASVIHEHAWARGVCELPIERATHERIVSSGVRAVVLATPHETAAELAPALLDAGLTVVDLSAGFRLRDAAAYPEWYGFEHPAPGLLSEAVYGMPEISRDGLAGATLIAAPGCYPTASVLGLWPLVSRGLLAQGEALIVDAVSGISGAGRGATQQNLFAEVSQRAYGLLGHRHRPEIAQALGLAPAGVVFTPSVGPYERGILATMHAKLASGVGPDEVAGAFAESYAGEAFVRLFEPITGPGSATPTAGGVARTNFCDLAFAVEGDRVIVLSTIDNLVKGAAGQGVQCLNAALGLDETLGLLPGASSGVLS